MKLSTFFDHTLLRPDSTLADIKKICEEAVEFGFASVCVPPYYVGRVAQLLEKSEVKVTTVIGFPMGYTTTMAKIEEVTALLTDEIDLFQKSVSKLSQETEKIKNITFEVDTDKIYKIFEQFNKKLVLEYKLNEELHTRIRSKLNSTMAIPRWLIISVFSIIAFLLFSIGFNIYQNNKIEVVRTESYENGANQVKAHMVEFFKENPKSHKTYESWKAK